MNYLTLSGGTLVTAPVLTGYRSIQMEFALWYLQQCSMDAPMQDLNPALFKNAACGYPQQVLAKDLLAQFRYVRSPQAVHSLLLKT